MCPTILNSHKLFFTRIQRNQLPKSDKLRARGSIHDIVLKYICYVFDRTWLIFTINGSREIFLWPRDVWFATRTADPSSGMYSGLVFTANTMHLAPVVWFSLGLVLEGRARAQARADLACPPRVASWYRWLLPASFPSLVVVLSIFDNT